MNYKFTIELPDTYYAINKAKQGANELLEQINKGNYYFKDGTTLPEKAAPSLIEMLEQLIEKLDKKLAEFPLWRDEEGAPVTLRPETPFYFVRKTFKTPSRGSFTDSSNARVDLDYSLSDPTFAEEFDLCIDLGKIDQPKYYYYAPTPILRASLFRFFRKHWLDILDLYVQICPEPGEFTHKKEWSEDYKCLLRTTEFASYVYAHGNLKFALQTDLIRVSRGYQVEGVSLQPLVTPEGSRFKVLLFGWFDRRGSFKGLVVERNDREAILYAKKKFENREELV